MLNVVGPHNIVTKEAPQWLAPTGQKIFENRPSALA